MKVHILLVVSLCLTGTLLFADDRPGDFNAAVQSAGKEFTDAINSGDAARVASLYTENAIAFPPNAEMVKGREAIQAFWKGIIDAGMKIKLETVETESEENLGMEVGRFTILGTDGKTLDQGKYVVVWKKEGGNWKLYRDIWNTSMPAPAAASK